MINLIQAEVKCNSEWDDYPCFYTVDFNQYKDRIISLLSIFTQNDDIKNIGLSFDNDVGFFTNDEGEVIQNLSDVCSQVWERSIIKVTYVKCESPYIRVRFCWVGKHTDESLSASITMSVSDLTKAENSQPELV
jgi:hypothetical protein